MYIHKQKSLGLNILNIIEIKLMKTKLVVINILINIINWINILQYL